MFAQPDRAASVHFRRPTGFRCRPLAVAVGLFLGLQAPVGAVTYVWRSVAVNGSWNNNANWVGDVRPISALSAELSFGASNITALQQNLNSFNLQRLAFTSTASNYTINGSTLRFESASNQIVVDAGSQVLNTAIVIGNPLTITNATDLTLNGALFNTAGTTPTITKTGAGRLTLGGNNSLDGSLVVNQGALLVSHANALQLTQLTLGNSASQLSFQGLASANVERIQGSGSVSLGGTTLNITGDSDSALGGVVSGSGGLNKTGAGALSLSRVNTFNGASSFGNGAITLLDGRALQFSPVTLGSGAELRFQFVTSATLPSVAGAGKLTLGSTALTLTGSNDSVYTGSLTGTGPILKAGTGTWTVGQDSVYSGDLTISGGRVVVASNRALGSARVVLSVDGGLAFGSSSPSFAGLTGNGALSLGSSAALTLTVGNATNGSFGGVISGAGALAKAGTGIWTLSGANTFSGGLTVQQGLVELNHAQAAGSGPLAVQAGATARFLNVPAAAVRSVAGAGEVRLDDTVLTLGSASDTAAMSTSFSGQMNGNGGVVKTGAASWVLNSSLAYTGNTVVNGGRIVVQHGPALAQSRVVLNVNEGLQFGAGLTAATVGGLSGNGALSLGGVDLTVGLRAGAQDVYTGVLRGQAGSSLIVSGVAGGSSLTLRNIPATGQATPVLPTLSARQGAALVLDNVRTSVFVSSLQQGVNAADGTLRLMQGSTVVVGSYDSATQSACGSVIGAASGAGLISIEGLGSSLSCALGANSGFSVFSGGALQLAGGGRMEAQLLQVSEGGAVRVQGASQLNATELSFSGGDARDTSTLIVGGADSRLRVTGATLLQGRGLGSATMTLEDGSVANLQSLTVRTGGGVSLSGDARLAVSGLLVQDNGYIQLDVPAVLSITGAQGANGVHGQGLAGGGQVDVHGTGYRQSLNLGDAFYGGVSVRDGATLTPTGNGITRYEAQANGMLFLARGPLGHAVVSAQALGMVEYQSPVLQGGLLMGAGTHDLARVAQFSGTTFASGVLVRPAASATLIGVTNSGYLDVVPGRSVRFLGGLNQGGEVVVGGTANVTSWQSAGGQVRVTGNLGTQASGGDLRFFGGAQLLIGSAAAPGGVLTLGGTNKLQLNDALLVNNGVVRGSVFVNYGSLAKGAGTFDGPVTVTDGGRFSPGNSPGAATTGNAVWGLGGAYLVELAAASGAAGTAWDLWNVNGALTVTSGTSANSVFTLSLATLDGNDAAAPLADFDPSRNYSWTVLRTSGGIVGFDGQRVVLDTSGFLNATLGGSFVLAQQGNDLVLNFTAAVVPEPGTWALWLLGLAAVGGLARRRAPRSEGGPGHAGRR